MLSDLDELYIVDLLSPTEWQLCYKDDNFSVSLRRLSSGNLFIMCVCYKQLRVITKYDKIKPLIIAGNAGIFLPEITVDVDIKFSGQRRVFCKGTSCRNSKEFIALRIPVNAGTSRVKPIHYFVDFRIDDKSVQSIFDVEERLMKE